MTDSWLLRRATAGDLDQIMPLEEHTFGSDAWSREVMAAEIASPHCYYLVACPVSEPDRIDAYAGLQALPGATDADIQTIAVGERARRQGLGRTLMHQLMTEARQRGARQLFLEVRADNPGAQALYVSLGFDSIAVRPRYYQPEGVDAVIMRCVLQEPRTVPAVGA